MAIKMQQTRTMSVVPPGGISAEQVDSREKGLGDSCNTALGPHSLADPCVYSRHGRFRIGIHRAY